jgi:hypothetical protein
MKRAWLATLVVLGWGGATLLLAEGCKDTVQDDEPAASQGPLTGADIVHGVVGASGPGGVTNDEGKGDPQLEAVAEALTAEIEAETPGRLDQIATDLRSRDAQRVVAAKILLDQSIAAAANGKGFVGRATGGGLVTHSLRPLDNAAPQPQQLVDAGQQLLCEQPKDANGQPLHLGQVNGRYGDGNTGASGALADTSDLVDTTDPLVLRTLNRVDSGALTPDPDSRLGAYAATRGYPAGTVGNAVHIAIGTIYVTFANYGQEKIGRVFNAPQAKALYNQPVASCAGMQMALLEYQYWSDVQSEDAWSAGGHMGSMFNPTVRNWLQTKVF